MSTKPTYLPDPVYFVLIDDLLAASNSFDPRTRVIELIGEIADVWPQKVLGDVDKN